MPLKISVYLTHPTVACFNLGEAQRRRLAARVPGAEVVRSETDGAFLESLADAQVAIVWRFEQAWLARAPLLEWIATPAAGHDYFELVSRPGLEIVYGSFHGPLIAETVLGMLLGHCRGLFAGERLRREHDWPRREVADVMRTLHGARITILGFGAIGRWIGRLAKPLGTHITGVSRRRGVRPEYFDAADEVVAQDALDACLPRTDFLVLALPAGRETDRLLDARRLRLLSEHAVVVNVGRGNAIDEDALAAALAAGRLGGAYLDVFAQEPLPKSSPLRTTPNTFLFPHASACAPQYLDLFADEFVGRFERRYGSAGHR